jgi:integrase
MAKKRTGSIQMHGGQLQARHRITIDGVTVRRWFPLGTTSWGLARAKNKDLIARLARGEVPDVAATAEAELCTAAFVRVIDQKRDDGLKSWRGPAQLLRDYAVPVMGHLRVDQVTPPHIRDALVYCRDKGRAKATVEMLRTALSGVFKALCRDLLLKSNPVTLVPMLKMEEDKRPRQLLTDEEFIRFVTFSYAPLRLRTMAVVSRAFGGMRTSDLHAWDWKHIDSLVRWDTALIRRPKTDGMRRHQVPEEIRTWLMQWWQACGQPTKGPVFGQVKHPTKRCTRSGYAKDLRYWLQAAGLDRAELFANNEETKQVDFHSFRRAYCSALAVSGVNAQTAMQLAAHSKMETHMMYMGRAVPLATPAGIVPAMGPAVGPSPAAARRTKPNNSNGDADLQLAAGDESRACRMGTKARSVRLFVIRPVGSRPKISRLFQRLGPEAWTMTLAEPPSARAPSSPPGGLA